MKSGYDQFFKKARENAQTQAPGAAKRPAGKPRFQMPKASVNESPVSMKVSRNTTELAERLRHQMQTKKKVRRSKVPWKLAGISFLGIVFAVGGMLYHEQIESVAKRIEFSLIGQAIAEEPKAEYKDEKKEAKKEAAQAAAEAPKKEFTDEEVNHFMKLNDRKKELDAREEELNRMEQELAAQKADLEKRMQNLEKTRRDISSVLEERVKTDDKKVETLVQMYSNMKPQQAAKVFEEMDEDLAVDIIGRMKKKNAAEIMNLIKPEKAKVFAEKFAGYKRS